MSARGRCLTAHGHNSAGLIDLPLYILIGARTVESSTELSPQLSTFAESIDLDRDPPRILGRELPIAPPRAPRSPKRRRRARRPVGPSEPPRSPRRRRMRRTRPRRRRSLARSRQEPLSAPSRALCAPAELLCAERAPNWAPPSAPQSCSALRRAAPTRPRPRRHCDPPAPTRTTRPRQPPRRRSQPCSRQDPPSSAASAKLRIPPPPPLQRGGGGGGASHSAILYCASNSRYKIRIAPARIGRPVLPPEAPEGPVRPPV